MSMVKKCIFRSGNFLWPLRDIIDMLNRSGISVGDSFKDIFEKELSFTLFHKARTQYIFNCKIPQNTCLCETCENVILLARGLNQACKKSIPCDLPAIVEEYSCNSNKKDSMLSICEECKSHRLEQNDYNKRNDKTEENDGDSSSSPDISGDDVAVCKYYQCKKRAYGYLRSV